jgi:hypothetical protein
LVDWSSPDDDRKHVAEKVAEADDADGFDHALIAGGQLKCD